MGNNKEKAGRQPDLIGLFPLILSLAGYLNFMLFHKTAFKWPAADMFPFFSRKYKGPSFLNSDPETGHIHRIRSKTVQKAVDYINVILVKHRLAGDHYMDKAVAVLKKRTVKGENPHSAT